MSENTTAILAPLNKQGKVTLNTDKAVNILNSSSSATQLAVAITGKGAIAKIAKSAVRSSVITLDQLLTSPTIDGSQWGDLLAMLVAEFGLSNYSKAMSGKSGCQTYCRSVALDAERKFLRAETVKAQRSAQSTLEKILNAQANVVRLAAVHQHQVDAAIAAQDAAESSELAAV